MSGKGYRSLTPMPTKPIVCKHLAVWATVAHTHAECRMKHATLCHCHCEPGTAWYASWHTYTAKHGPMQKLPLPLNGPVVTVAHASCNNCWPVVTVASGCDESPG